MLDSLPPPPSPDDRKREGREHDLFVFSLCISYGATLKSASDAFGWDLTPHEFCCVFGQMVMQAGQVYEGKASDPWETMSRLDPTIHDIPRESIISDMGGTLAGIDVSEHAWFDDAYQTGEGADHGECNRCGEKLYVMDLRTAPTCLECFEHHGDRRCPGCGVLNFAFDADTTPYCGRCSANGGGA